MRKNVGQKISPPMVLIATATETTIKDGMGNERKGVLFHEKNHGLTMTKNRKEYRAG